MLNERQLHAKLTLSMALVYKVPVTLLDRDWRHTPDRWGRPSIMAQHAKRLDIVEAIHA